MNSLRSYILLRLLGVLPLLLAISFVSFVIIQLSPGDPAEIAVRVNRIKVTPEVIEATRVELGLDKPFFERYLTWLGNALQGDFGTRYSDGKSVAGEIARAFPASLLLAGCAALIIVLISIPAALAGCFREGRFADTVLRGMVFLGTSLPVFWAGLLLIWLFSVHLHVFPTGGMAGPVTWVLPALTLSLPYLSTYTRLLRNSMLQAREQTFVLYYRALGCRPSRIALHIFRNSLQSTLTALGMSLPKLIAGSFVVECIFAWPGLGRLCVQAIFNRDLPVLQAWILLMGAFFVLCNLAMEILAAIVDPRRRERSGQ